MRHLGFRPRLAVPAALSALLLTGGAALAQGNWLDKGRELLGGGGGGAQAPGGGAAGISAAQAEQGLREALRVASRRTVERLSRPGGYLGDPAVKIPLPGYLANARDMMAKAGMSGMLDDLETRMNRAAEAAAPKAAGIFGEAIAGMSVSDARAIVAGPEDAATQYFKRTTTVPLTEAFKPIVERSLSEAGATQLFQKVSQSVSAQAGGMGGLGALAGLAGGGGGAGGAAGFDFTDYAVEKALAGLFHYVGQEEAAIRRDPAARTTEILKQVFGR